MTTPDRDPARAGRDVEPRSIFDRWADAATPEAFDVVVAPKPVPDGPVLEDPDPARVPYGTTF